MCVSKTIDSRTNKTWLGSTRIYAVVSRFRFVTIFFIRISFIILLVRYFREYQTCYMFCVLFERFGMFGRWKFLSESRKIVIGNSCEYNCGGLRHVIRDCHAYSIFWFELIDDSLIFSFKKSWLLIEGFELNRKIYIKRQ